MVNEELFGASDFEHGSDPYGKLGTTVQLFRTVGFLLALILESHFGLILRQSAFASS